MPVPRASSAYPPPFGRPPSRDGCGEIFIPPPSEGVKFSNNLRLQFYGLFERPRREGQPELGEALTLTSQTIPGIRVAWRDTGKISALVAAAFKPQAPPPTNRRLFLQTNR